MLEMFEKDDTDMQSSSSDFVPIVQYETLRKEFEVLQERLSQAQASDEASSVAEDRYDPFIHTHLSSHHRTHLQEI